MKLFVPKWICESDSQIETRNYPRFLCASICRQKWIRFCFRVDQTGRASERVVHRWGEKCGWRWKIRTKFFHFMELQLKLPTPNGQYWWRSPTDEKSEEEKTQIPNANLKRKRLAFGEERKQKNKYHPLLCIASHTLCHAPYWPTAAAYAVDKERREEKTQQRRRRTRRTTVNDEKVKLIDLNTA